MQTPTEVWTCSRFSRNWWRSQRPCVRVAAGAASWGCRRRRCQSCQPRWWVYWASDLSPHWQRYETERKGRQEDRELSLHEGVKGKFHKHHTKTCLCVELCLDMWTAILICTGVIVTFKKRHLLNYGVGSEGAGWPEHGTSQLVWTLQEKTDEGRRLAKLLERASHVQRLWPCCIGPKVESRPGALCCILLPLSHPVSYHVFSCSINKRSQKIF